MSNIPENLQYTKSHEWLRKEEDGAYTLGITEHAQESLGDLVFVELPKVGDTLDSGSECAVVESVKAASDIYSPLKGEVVAVNESLEENPENINNDPYGEGWILRLQPGDEDPAEQLLGSEEYARVVEEEEGD